MRQYNGIQLREGVTAAAHKLCSLLDLIPVTLEWRPQAATASMSSSGTMILPDVADDKLISKQEFMRFVGYVIHELLHRKYTDFSASLRGSYLFQLHNAVEDIWIEREGIKAGLLGNIEECLTVLINDVVDLALADVTNWTDPCQYPFALAVTGRRYAKRVPLATGCAAIFEEASNRIDACKSTADTAAVAQWVFDQLKNLDDHADQEEQRKQSKQGEEGEQDAGDGQEGASEGAGDADGAGEGEGEGEGSKAPEQAPSAGRGKPVGGVNDRAVKVEPSLHVSKYSGGGTYYDNSTVLRNYSGLRDAPRYSADMSAASAKLRNELRRLLDNSATEEQSFNRRAGTLNTRAIHRAGFDDRLFGRRTEQAGIETACMILLDISGSMSYRSPMPDGTERQRTEIAVPAVCALLDTLHRAQAKTCVATFGDEYCVIKTWADSVQRGMLNVRRVNVSGSTNDYPAVRHSHEELHRRPEQRKILLVVTDGQGDQNTTRQQVLAGENLGITTVGVGIGCNVSATFPKSICIRNLSDLANASFKQIKLAI